MNVVHVCLHVDGLVGVWGVEGKPNAGWQGRLPLHALGATWRYVLLPTPPGLMCAGQTRLSQAQASARLSEARQLSFNVEVVPAEGHRQAGYVRAGGMVPLADAAVASSSGGKDNTQQQQQQQQMDVRLSVKDGGMALLTSVTPDLRWQGGLAVVDVRLRGPIDQPVLSGTASISRATLDCPLLRFPLTNVSTEVRAGGGLLMVDSLEARCGRRGHLKARGSLPVYGSASGVGGSVSLPLLQQHGQNKLLAEASGLELRVRNLYSGQYDANLAVTNSLASPTVAGGMRFSRGIVFMVPQGAAGDPPAPITLLTPPEPCLPRRTLSLITSRSHDPTCASSLSQICLAQAPAAAAPFSRPLPWALVGRRLAADLFPRFLTF